MEPGARIELTRDDLVMEIGEQAITRVLAEKQLIEAGKTIKLLHDALQESRDVVVKGEEYKKSADRFYEKNERLNEEIELLRSRLITTEKALAEAIKKPKKSTKKRKNGGEE